MTPFEDETERRSSDPAMPSATMRSSILPEGVRVILERARTTPSIRPADPGPEGLRAACAAQRRAAGAALGASVERVTVEVRIGSRTEIVALGLDGTRLLVASSDGGGENSPFAQAALAWLDAGEAGEGGPPRPAASVPATAPQAVRSSGADLLVAIARGGVRAGASPAVLEALARIASEPRGAVPLVRSRWLARVSAALADVDGDLVARLTSAGPPPVATSAMENAVDRSFIEVAREALAGDSGTTIERRYLVDAGSGEILLEERVLSDPGASLGPCPRLCAVGFGEIFAGVPRRIIVSQYAVVPEVASEHWDRVLGCAVPIEVASKSALAAMTDRGDAEPVAVVLGAVVDDASLSDDAGTKYPLLDSEATRPAVLALLAAAQETPLRWVLVRFEAACGTVGVVPLACASRDGDTWRHVRLR